jgi:hypothetical protein
MQQDRLYLLESQPHQLEISTVPADPAQFGATIQSHVTAHFLTNNN